MEKVLVWQSLRMHIGWAKSRDWKVYTENADKSTVKLNKCIVVFNYVEIKGKDETQNLERSIAESLIKIPLVALAKMKL